jgi:hypothetical protein
VNRLRSFAHDYLLPLVISALVLRALIPAGFMPGHGAGLSLTATLCNTPSQPDSGRAETEVIEIAGSGMPSGVGAMHCDFCLVPVLGAVYTFPPFAPPAAISADSSAERPDAPPSRFALDRAQIPRAPPLA